MMEARCTAYSIGGVQHLWTIHLTYVILRSAHMSGSNAKKSTALNAHTRLKYVTLQKIPTPTA